MQIAALNSTTAAFAAGVVTSLHCAAMCGPLACSLIPSRGDRADPHTINTIYHVTRLTGYAVLGAIAGGLGRTPLSWISTSVWRWMPWLIVLFFIALGLRWDHYLPRLPLLSRFYLGLQSRVRGRSGVEAAAMLGLVTPLLPCGPLYLVLTAALLSGSAARGLEFMLAFGLGTVPLLWVAQANFHWLRRRLPPLWLSRTRIALALGCAGLVGWRLRATLGFSGPDPLNFICF